MFTDVAKFKAAKIDPRFYTDAKSLGIPINLRPLQQTLITDYFKPV